MGKSGSKNQSARTDLVQALLEELLRVAPGEPLPTMLELATRWKVGNRAVARAAAELERQGRLRIVRGRGMLRSDPGVEMGPQARLVGGLREELATGRLRAGEVLPKVEALAREHRVSTHTVIAALRSLEADSLVHKEGRTWKAGPNPAVRGGAFRAPELPVILIVTFWESTWGSQGQNERVQDFFRVFASEARSAGVRLAFGVAGEKKVFGHADAYGLGQVSELRRRLGARCMGVLLVGARKEFPGLDVWLARALEWGVRVAWFSHVREEAPLLGPEERRRFAWAIPEEEGALRSCIEHLRALGHRKAAYVNWIDIDWASKRLRRLRRLSHPGSSMAGHPESGADSASVSPRTSLEILPVRRPEEWARRNYPPPGWLEMLRALDRKGTDLHRAFQSALATKAGGMERRGDRYAALARKIRAWLLDPAGFDASSGLSRYEAGLLYRTAILGPVVCNPEVTAIIGPNDQLSRHIHAWLRAAGVRVPKDITLISFDNYWTYSLSGVTTLDFGLGHQGYLAFQWLLGSLPIRRRNDCSLPAKPLVVDKGSAGPPRTASLPQGIVLPDGA